MIELLLIFVLSILISCSPFIKKILLRTFELDEVMIMEQYLVILPLIVYTLYKLVYTKHSFTFMKKITTTHVCFLVFLMCSAIIGAILYNFLLSNFSITKIVPILSPLIIVFTILIGFCFFNETLTKNEWFGILFIILGIYIAKSTFLQSK